MAETQVDIPQIIAHVHKHEKRFGVFKGLSDSELADMLKEMVTVFRPPEKMLFRKGQPAREMYIIMQGRVDIVDTYQGKHKVIAVLSEGEVFGEMALFGDHMRTASAKTHTAVLLLVLNEDSLFRVVANSKGGPVFIMNLLRVLTERLESMTHRYMKAKYGEKLPEDPVRRWID